MLTDADYQYLDWIVQNNGHVPRGDAELYDNERTQKLLHLGCVEYFFARSDGNQYHLTSYWITLKGMDALCNHQKAQQQMQKAKEEAAAQKKHAAAQQLNDLRSAKKEKYLSSWIGAMIRGFGAFAIEHIDHIPAGPKRLIEIMLGK